MKKIVIFCSCLLALNAAAYCGQATRIELSDGSVINGEITAFTEGVYTINTAAFGEIKVDGSRVSKIESIESFSPGEPVSPIVQEGNLDQSKIDSYRQTLMSNPENAAIVTGLAADPRIQELAQDPEIINAAKSGDIQTLMKNEKFMSIVNSPQMQEAVRKLKQ